MSDQNTNPSAPVSGTGQPDTQAAERLDALRNAPKPNGPITMDGKPNYGGGITKVAGDAVGTAPGSGEASVSRAAENAPQSDSASPDATDEAFDSIYLADDNFGGRARRLNEAVRCVYPRLEDEEYERYELMRVGGPSADQAATDEALFQYLLRTSPAMEIETITPENFDDEVAMLLSLGLDVSPVLSAGERIVAEYHPAEIVEHGVEQTFPAAPMRLMAFASNPTKPMGKRLSLDALGALEKETVGGWGRGLDAKQVIKGTLKELAHAIAVAKPNLHMIAGFGPEGLVTPKVAPGQNRDKTTHHFPQGPGMLIIDSDDVRSSVFPALVAACPALANYSRLEKPSSGSHIVTYPAGSELKGMSGQHTFFHVADGSDIPRAMLVLFKRCWLTGSGTIRAAKDGSLLVRGPVDRQMMTSVQPIFMWPVLGAGLDQKKVIDLYHGIEVLDTRAVLPDLTTAEEAAYQAAVRAAKELIAPAAKQTADKYERVTIKKMQKATPGLTEEGARAAFRKSRQSGETLAPEWLIRLDRASPPVTVAEVLAGIDADPAAWRFRTCCDPIEHDYGSETVAMIFVNENGSVIINSKAHGGNEDAPRVFYLRKADGAGASSAFEDFAEELGDAPDIPDEEPAMSPGEVVAKLRTMTREEAGSAWKPWVLPLDRVGRTEVMETLVGLFGWGIRDLKGDLADYEAGLRNAEQVERMADRVGGRAVVELDIVHPGKTAKRVERALLGTTPDHQYAMFSNELACIDVRVIPHTHEIDRPDLLPPPVVLIAPMLDAEIVAKINRNVALCTLNDAGKPVSEHPVPVPIIQQLRSSLREFGPRNVPLLSGVATRPMVLLDGSILNTAGLDRRTGIYLHETGVMPIRAFDRTEAESALKELLSGEFSRGFEFATQLDHHIAVAGLLTAVQRRLLPEAPGLAAKARVQASGKTTLLRRIHLILTGRDMPVATVPGSEVEMEKLLFSLLRVNPEMICFDNFPDGNTFFSPSLAAAMTSSEMTSRVLGESRDGTVPTNTFWTLSGNNIGLDNDALTRWMVTELSPSALRPEQRVFEQPDVAAHGRLHRVAILQLVLGIISGYLLSGEKITPGARYPAWDRSVRQPLIWAGGIDIAEGFERNTDESRDKTQLADLIDALMLLFAKSGGSFTLSELTSAMRLRGEASRTECDHVRTLAVVAESLEGLGVKDLTSTKLVGTVMTRSEMVKVKLGDGSPGRLRKGRHKVMGNLWFAERVR